MVVGRSLWDYWRFNKKDSDMLTFTRTTSPGEKRNRSEYVSA
ncbi:MULTISPECIES: hypothetical protein [Lachnospiraceae]|nr:MULTISPECIES: hypothetical protein [Clostridia]GKH35059.1 hypothetical protein CE91St64_44660 [Faecalicatena contorta]